jgi:hypothetical protein
MTSEFGSLKSNIDGALINHDALLRQYIKTMIMQMGAESNFIFRDLFAAADRNAIQNRDIINRVYHRLAITSNEMRTSIDSLRIISTTWENTFYREIHSSENRLIRILGINKDEQTSSILTQSNNEYKALSRQLSNVQKAIDLQFNDVSRKILEPKHMTLKLDKNLDQTKSILESTDFIKHDLEFISSNEEEIMNLNEGILNKFETVLSKEDDMLVSQIELHNSTEFIREDLNFVKENEQEIKIYKKES